MTSSSANKRAPSYTVVLLLVVYAVAFNKFTLMDADNDLWGHIKFGELIWSLNALPETNTFAFTAPDHPWVNHEWLTEVIFYLIYDAFDSTGLLVFKLLVGVTILTLLSSLYFAREKNAVAWFLYCMVLIPLLAP
jgi:hypothetical protein